MKTNQMNDMEFENIAEIRTWTLQDIENALLELFANTDSVDYGEWRDIAKEMQEQEYFKHRSTRKCKRND